MFGTIECQTEVWNLEEIYCIFALIHPPLYTIPHSEHAQETRHTFMTLDASGVHNLSLAGRP